MKYKPKEVTRAVLRSRGLVASRFRVRSDNVVSMMSGAGRVCAILLCACAARADEGGKLLLHFLQLPVGEETYSITTQPDGSLFLSANFDYTERGSHVPLVATLRMKPDLTPLAFEAKGKSYRPFSVNAAVMHTAPQDQRLPARTQFRLAWRSLAARAGRRASAR